MLRIKQFNATFSKHKSRGYKYCCKLTALHHSITFYGYANTKKQALYQAYNSYKQAYGLTTTTTFNGRRNYYRYAALYASK